MDSYTLSTSLNIHIGELDNWIHHSTVLRGGDACEQLWIDGFLASISQSKLSIAAVSNIQRHFVLLLQVLLVLHILHVHHALLLD